MKKLTRRIRYLLLSCLLFLPLVTGCAGNNGIPNAPDRSTEVSYTSGMNRMLVAYQTVTCVRTSLPPMSMEAPYGTLSLRNSDCASISVTGMDSTIIIKDVAGYTPTAIGAIYCNQLVEVQNPPGTVKNAVVSPNGNGTSFTNMPDKLILEPGAWATVAGVRYDNTNGTADMVLALVDNQNNSSNNDSNNDSNNGSNNPPPAFAAPLIDNVASATNAIYLQDGYAAVRSQAYSITGNPAPTTAMTTAPAGNTAGATISGNTLTIPVGLTNPSGPYTEYTANFEATNSQGTATMAVTVYVYNTLYFTPSLTPDRGQVGTQYTGSLSVSGGSGEYSYALTSGALPAGLTLNASSGDITGTPTATASSTFTITVTDNKTDATASEGFTLAVDPATP